MFKALRTHRGFMMLAIVFVFLAIAVVVLAIKAGFLISESGLRFSKTQDILTRIQQNLVQYVAVNRELPCPADPSVTSVHPGYPDSNLTVPSPATTCQYPAGVVPWKALGLSLSEVTDEWGRLISYRVFDGTIGLTQDQGASKVDCDTSRIDLVGRKVPETAPVNGLCASDRNTFDTSFTHHSTFLTNNNDKGLIVNDFGTPVPKVAYVLISHGASGLGGWLQSGSKMMPLPTALSELANTQASTPPAMFNKMAASAPNVVAGATGHYDDVVAYQKIDDLAKLAKLEARDWPEARRLGTDIQDFNLTTTSNLTNTATTDHFLTTTSNTSPSAAENFQQALSGAGVSFGAASGTFSSCLWWPNLIDLYSPPSATATTGTTWASGSGGVITFTTTANHNFAIGDAVTVTGASQAGYNGTYAVTGTTSNTFTVAKSVNPGVWVSGGTIKKMSSLATGTSWAGGVITFTTLANHNYLVGSVIVVSGASPTDYNGTYTVTATPTATTFKVTEAVDPGTWVSGGIVAPGIKRTLIVSVQAAFNTLTGSSDAGGGLTVGFLPHRGFWVNAGTPSAITLSPTLTISSASWSSAFFPSRITFTTSGTLPFSTGNTVVVTGVLPVAYNGTYTVTGTGTPSPTSFTVSRSNPGAYVSGGTVTSNLCGSSAGTSRIGWDNALDFVADGNLPTPRFAVEMDMQANSTRNDPTDNNSHVAVDSDGVTHGTNAATCADTFNTYHSIALTTLKTGTTWSGGVITFATLTNHNLASGNIVRVTNSPGGYNGVYSVTGTPALNTFTVVDAIDPGTWTSGGTVGINDCYTGLSDTWLMDGLTSFHKVRVEIEPMSSSCGSTRPLLRYWLLPFSVCNAPKTLVTGTSWSGGVITFTTSSNHGFVAGNVVAVTGASPATYNGKFTITSTTPTAFTAARATNPGAWISAGTVTPQDCTDIEDVSVLYAPTSLLGGGVYLANCIPTPNPADAYDSVYFGFTSNNTSSGNTTDNFILQKLNSNLISVP